MILGDLKRSVKYFRYLIFPFDLQWSGHETDLT